MASNFRAYNPIQFNCASFLSKLNPCCGYSLDKAAKIISIAHIAISGYHSFIFLLAIPVTIVLLFVHDNKPASQLEELVADELDSHTHGRKNNIRAILELMIMTVCSILYFCISCLLYKGVKEGNFKKITLWCQVMFTVMIVVLIHVAILAVRHVGEVGEGHHLYFPIMESLSILFCFYSIWVMYEFKKDIRRNTDSTVEFDSVL